MLAIIVNTGDSSNRSHKSRSCIGRERKIDGAALDVPKREQQEWNFWEDGSIESLKPSPRTFTPNLHLHTEQYILRKN